MIMIVAIYPALDLVHLCTVDGTSEAASATKTSSSPYALLEFLDYDNLWHDDLSPR